MSARISVSVKGLKPLQNKLLRLPARINKRTGMALTKCAKKIMRESKRMTPKDQDGHLRASAFIDPPLVSGPSMTGGIFGFFQTPVAGGITVTMGYGRTGPSTAYALAAHEHLSKYSPFSWRIAEARNRPVNFYTSGTGPKYLETPFRTESSNILATVASAKLID